MRAMSGLPPILSFGGFTDPVEALAAARHIVSGGAYYATMTDAQLQRAVRQILATCWTIERARARIRAELACPMHVMLTYHGPYLVGQMHGRDGVISL